MRAWADARRARTRSGWEWPLVIAATVAFAVVMVFRLAAPDFFVGDRTIPGWFHPLVEMVAIVCFAIVFIVGWNAHGPARPLRPTLLAIAFLCVAWLDMLHVLTMPGMDVFGSLQLRAPRVPNESLWLWIFARVFTFGGLLALALIRPGSLVGNAAARTLLIAALMLAAGASVLGVRFADRLPALMLPLTGLTSLKIGLEIGFAVLGFAIAWRFLTVARRQQGPLGVVAVDTSRGLFAVSALFAIAELCLVSYGREPDALVLLGHLYKLIAALILYRGMLLAGIRMPFESLSDAVRTVRYRERQLDAIIGTAMDSIITVDGALRIRVFNSAAESTFGCRASEVLGGPLDRFIPLPVRASHEGWMREFGKSGRPVRSTGDAPAGAIEGATGPDRDLIGFDHVVNALRADGSVFPIHASISRVHAAGEQLYTVILRDVSAERDAREQLQVSYDEVRALSARLQQVREDERAHLSRELHDDLGQTLAAMRMDIAALRADLSTGTPVATEALESLDRLSSAAVGSSRRLVADLRPPPLEEGGLFDALAWLVADNGRRGGPACAFEASGECEALDPVTGLALYRLAQEALHNAMRHADATRITLAAACGKEVVELAISDDGKGMSLGTPRRKDAFGLVGMRERVHALGGTITIDSAPGAGTRLLVRVPLHSDQTDSVQEKNPHRGA